MFEQVKVKSYKRQRKGKIIYVKSFSRKEDIKKRLNKIAPNVATNEKKGGDTKKILTKLAVGTGITVATLGLGGAGYAQYLRTRYRKNLGNMAKAATKQSKEKAADLVTDIADKNLKYENINISVSGALKHDQKEVKSEILTRKVKDNLKGHSVGIDTSEYNLLRNKKTPTNTGKLLSEMYGAEIHHVRKGFNPAAINTAATAMAYMDKYPSKNIVIYGHSAGGFIANEAMHIIEAAGYPISRVKQVTLGGSYYGMFPVHRNTLNLVNAEDLQTLTLRKKRHSKITRIINKPKDFSLNKEILTRATTKKGNIRGIGYKHLISDYTDSPEAMSYIKEFTQDGKLDPTFKPSESDIKPATKKVQPVLTLNEALTKKLNSARKDYEKALEKYKEQKQSTKIPEATKPVVLKRSLVQYRDKRRAYLKLKKNISTTSNS
jgi:hypothetical protein